MENTTFIPANQLPEAEGDEVSVLCVEGGELKQKPAKGLGGGGGGYDMKVRIWFEDTGDEMYPQAELLEGDFATALEKVNNDTPVVVRVIEDGLNLTVEQPPYKYIGDYPAATLRKNTDDGTYYLSAFGFNIGLAILPDNTAVADWR